MRYLSSISLALIVHVLLSIGILMALACTATPAEPAANIDATVAAAVAATRTASDVQEKVAATLRAPTPTTAENHYNKGVDYAEAGQYENAIQEFGKAIQLDPDDAYAYFNRGSSYAELGQYQTAINDYTEAIQIHPGLYGREFFAAYYNRGEAYRLTRQWSLSETDKAKACQLDRSQFKQIGALADANIC